MAKVDENYTEKLINAVSTMIVETIENISIEDVNMYQIGYNKAIDEFISRLEKHTQENWIDHQEYGITWADIEQIAEQMKEGAE